VVTQLYEDLSVTQEEIESSILLPDAEGHMLKALKKVVEQHLAPDANEKGALTDDLLRGQLVTAAKVSTNLDAKMATDIKRYTIVSFC